MTPERLAARSVDVLRAEGYDQANPLHRLRYLVLAANEHSRDPIDQNFVAIPRNTWEDIVRLVNRGA